MMNFWPVNLWNCAGATELSNLFTLTDSGLVIYVQRKIVFLVNHAGYGKNILNYIVAILSGSEANLY
jgi:hypothetical protein